MIAALAATAGLSCVTVPPPDLTKPLVRRPIILADTASPRQDEILLSWPSEFTVSVELDEPSDGATWRVFVHDASDANDSAPFLAAGTITGTGIVQVPFSLPNPSPTSCEAIEFAVAHAFVGNSDAADDVGGDELTWFYMPNGVPNGCSTYDAGSDAYIGPIDDAGGDGEDP